MPRPHRPVPVPASLADELCQQLPFTHADPDAIAQLLQREHAARRGTTQLTVAEHAALDRLHQATRLLLALEATLQQQRRTPLAGRLLAATAQDTVVALLWRERHNARGHDPYGVQLVRQIDQHLTWLTPVTGLRVDHAWPIYHQQRWPVSPGHNGTG